MVIVCAASASHERARRSIQGMIASSWSTARCTAAASTVSSVLKYCEHATITMGNAGSHGVSLFKSRRGSLARVLLEKQRADRILDDYDKNQWYRCQLHSIEPMLRAKFVQLEADSDTMLFLEHSEDKSDWIFTQIWYSLARTVLSWFMTQTSINGWLQRGSMFVISLQQLLKLIAADDTWRVDALLDLGAGDGEVTARLAPVFRDVYVTEISQTMQNLLRRRGYVLLDIDKWSMHRKYDVISCLNLLDRCDKPIDLLNEMRTALRPDGFVLLALVLPFAPYVESGASDHQPRQVMAIKGRTFEEQITSFTYDVLRPAGFEVVTWSRVPYLCEGDLRQAYYWLDDSIFVLKAL